jgi:RimJ/RimL family protein N-acetyltransferase
VSAQSVFIAGEKIDICAPEDDDYGHWAQWLNDRKITAYLAQGKFPYSTTDQRAFVAKAKQDGKFVATIKTKAGQLIGSISLSAINYEQSSCNIALICPITVKSAPLGALEAMAQVTQHAFERFGMHRVGAGQAFPQLKKWTQRLEAIGYLAEGFTRRGFVSGRVDGNSVQISITRERFDSIVARRGELWPGEEQAMTLLSGLGKSPSFAERLSAALERAEADHDRLLAQLDGPAGDNS